MGSVPNLSKHPHFLLFPYIVRALHALDADGDVYVWGKAAFNLCCFTLIYPDANNTLR